MWTMKKKQKKKNTLFQVLSAPLSSHSNRPINMDRLKRQPSEKSLVKIKNPEELTSYKDQVSEQYS